MPDNKNNNFLPLRITGQCIESDEVLFANMDAAIALNLPEVGEMLPAHDGTIALVGSGPSLASQLKKLHTLPKEVPIVAIKDAHDWLIDRNILPHYALAIDPQEHRSHCFKLRHLGVHYMIASQCHPKMFENLRDHRVTIWHPYITKGQKRPADRMLIGGGTTSGLRAISLFYVLGWRNFALFGFDSCLDGKNLRVNGDGLKGGDAAIEVRLDPEGETFHCNAAMALQAQHFQDYFDYLPDATFQAYGHGLIQAILQKRKKNAEELMKIIEKPAERNNRVSFIHWGDKTQASWRYRANIPARELGLTLNDLTADTLIFAKPQVGELMTLASAKARGARIIVDFCDDHFDWPWYKEFLRMADLATCPTEVMAGIIKGHRDDISPVVIAEPYEYPQEKPHCVGDNLLWFGHFTNQAGILRIKEELGPNTNLRVIGSHPGATRAWSYETMLEEFAKADIVIIPTTAEYKSCNRAVEAIRQGCYVVAEPHPSLVGIPGIWIGDIKEGIEWATNNLIAANMGTLEAQKYVMERFSPQTVASAWRKAIQSLTTSDAEGSTGPDGSALTVAPREHWR